MPYNFKPEETEFIFQSFISFEEKFKEITKSLPYTKENKNSWSPQLVSLFIDICGIFDSVSRQIVGEGKDFSELTSIPRSNPLKKGQFKTVRQLDINDFNNNLFIPLSLLDRGVVLYIYFSYPDCVIKPFQDYLKTQDDWWPVYNSLKHNRLNNYTKATLEKTLRALSALFLLIISYKDEEFTRALLRFKILESNTVPEFVHSGRTLYPEKYWHDSSLFGSTESCDWISVNNAEDIPSFPGSRKFHLFIGRFNPK